MSVRWLWIILFLTPGGSAFASATSPFTYHGRILLPDGTPEIDANVQFKLQILSPGAGNCLLYEETQTLNMSNSAGAFTLTLNSTASTRTDGGTYSIEQIMSNLNGFTVGSCVYVPGPYDGRLFQVSFSDSTMGGAFDTFPSQSITYVPKAIDAEQVQGFTPSSLLRVANGGIPGTASSFSSAQFSALQALIAGTSNQYVTSSATGGAQLPTISGAPSSLTAGDLWFNSSTGQLQYSPDGSTTVTVGTSGAGISSLTTGNNLTANGTAGGTLTGPGTIDLNVTGVTAGTYTKVTVDQYGRVSSGAQITGSDITSGTIGGTTAISTSETIATTNNISAQNISANGASFRTLVLDDSNTPTPDTLTLSTPSAITSYALIFPNAGPTSPGQVLSISSTTTGQLSWVSPTDGTITGVTAGTGLSGGGTSGTVTVSLATATTSTIGGVESVNPVSHEWINSINSSGVPQLSQPSVSDLTAVADGSVLSNISGASAAPSANSLTSVIDHDLGNTQGDILYRDSTGNGGWKVLAPGSSGQLLQSGGPSANPTWATVVTGSGTVNSGTANDLAYYSATGAAVSQLSTSSSSVLLSNSSGVPTWTAQSADSFTQYALLAGRAGGQTLDGGTAASDNLTLNSTSAASPTGYVLLQSSGGDVGVGTTTPSHNLGFSGQSAQTIGMERESTAATVGNNLTISAGGATSGGTNLAGGNLYLSSGTATGNQSSSIYMQVPQPGGSGISDAAPTTIAVLNDSGIIVGGSVASIMSFPSGYTSSSATVNTPNGSWIAEPAVVVENGQALDGSASYFSLESKNTAGNIQNAYIGDVAVSGAGSYTPIMVFGHQTGANAYTETMRIDQNGNVGIGTTTISHTLEVNGSINATSIYVNGVAVGTGGGTISGVTAGTGLSGGGTSGSVTVSLANPTTSTIGGVEAVNPVSHEWVNSINSSGVPQLSQPAFSDISGSLTTSQLPSIANDDVLANTSGSAAAPVATSLSTLIDNAIGNTQGDILYRSGAGWSVLAPGTSGQFLQTGGASANPSWASGSSGTVTSVGLTMPGIFSVGGSPIAGSGTLAVSANGTSGGIPYFSSSSTLASSGTLTQYDVVLGGGTGNAPTVVSGVGTTGQVLTSNGTGAAPTWQSVSSVSSQWTTSGSNIYYNTGNVGIGTSSPAGTLDVEGGTAAGTNNGSNITITAQNSHGSNMNGGNINLNPGSGSGGGSTGQVNIGNFANLSLEGGSRISWQNDGAPFIVGYDSPNYLELSASGNMDMYIGSTGNVGIGTTTPQAALDVNGSIDIRGQQALIMPASDTQGGVGIGVGALGNEPALATGSYGNVAVGPYAMGGGQMTTSATSNTAMGYNALNAITVGSSNVAMGTGALSNDTTGASNTGVGSYALNNNTVGSWNTGVGNDALVGNISGTWNTAVGHHAQRAVTTGGNNTSVGVQSLYNANGSGNTTLGIETGWSLDSGNYNTIIGQQVGMGTLSTGSYNILIGTSSAVDTPATNTSNFLNIGNVIFATGMTGTLAAPAGNVGIGTTNPGGNLAIDNSGHNATLCLNGSCVSSLGGSGGLSTTGGTMTGELIGDSGSNTTPSFGFTSDTNTGFYDAGSHTIGVTNGGTESMTLGSNGITGTGAMTVASGGTNQVLTLDSSGTAAVNVGTGDGTGLSVLDPGAASADYVTAKGSASGGSPTIGTGGSDSNINLTIAPKGAGNTIFANGNVGIGTTNPGATLQVNKSSGCCAAIGVTGGNASTVVSQSPSGGGGSAAFWDNASIGYPTNFRMSNSAVDDTVAMTFLSNGNVGIGSSSPSDALDVQTSGTTYIRSTAALSGQSAFALSDTTNGQDVVIYRPGSTRDLAFYTTTAGNVMYIPQSGNVGIGVTNPSTALQVNGTVTASAFSGSLSGNASTATYATSAGSATTATSASSATVASQVVDNGVGNMTFSWSGQSGQPSWLWGSNDGVNTYVWNPSNFSVNYASSAGSVPATGVTGTFSSGPYTNDYFRVNGNGGIYWQSYGGGWYMQDSTWMRTYNNVSIYTPATVLAGTVEGTTVCVNGDCRSAWPGGLSSCRICYDIYTFDAGGYSAGPSMVYAGNICTGYSNGNSQQGAGGSGYLASNVSIQCQ